MAFGGAQRTRLATAGARATTQAVLRGQPRGDVIRNTLFAGLLLLAVVIALAGLFALVIQAFAKGSSALSMDLITNPPSKVFPEEAGFRPAIVGSLELIAGVLLFVVPVGIGAAIYLEEYADKSRWRNKLIKVNIQNLSAVPSIIYGILGLAFIVRGPMDLGFVLVAGALTLALLVLPMVIIAAREAIRAVPDSIRQASLALGATQWQTIRSQVLPASIPGIATGVILAVSRALGETAPLLLVGATVFVTFDPTPFGADGYSAMPVQIFNYAVQAQDEFQALAAAGIIVMLVVLLAMNSFAIWLRNRYEQRW
ncbi:MAG TPA: phosphate ABC transporter permease PstA [Solirubrobacterales bacterium]|nr:phosphate ABC transporter permease PstA [Solirubrobacterales bacterium]